MPFHGLAIELESEGISLDDSTMCRYAEHVGATLGCVVDTVAGEAKQKAFCLATDDPGAAIQPDSGRTPYLQSLSQIVVGRDGEARVHVESGGA